MCVLRWEREALFIALEVGFTANAHMEGDQVPWQPLLLEVHLGGNQARLGRPHLAASQPDLLLDGIFFDPYPYPLFARV